MLKKFIILLFVFISYIQAEKNSYSWGSKGYDHSGRGSRFTAGVPSYVKEKHLIIIEFDGKEGHTKGLKSIELIDTNGTRIISNRCWLSKKHITAPFACSFPIEEVIKLSDKGDIIINLNNNSSIKENIDFDKFIFLQKSFIDPKITSY